MKLSKLNQKGASHIILPILAVVVVALIGVKVLTASHADQINLTTSATSTELFGNNVAWEGPLNSNSPSSQIVQSSVPYTILGYQTVSLLAPGQSISYINGIKGNVQNCYDVYVRQPKSSTVSVTATISIANNNNTASFNLSSTTSDNLRRICVNPGTGTNPGYNIKNTTPINQNTNIEVADEQLRW